MTAERHSLLVRAWLTTCACSLTLLLVAAYAEAGTNLYCYGRVLQAAGQSGDNCAEVKHSLRRNYVATYYGGNTGVWASALTVSYQQYGSWMYGSGNVCKSYSGANVLYGWMANGHNQDTKMSGVMYWGSETPCP